jgi:NTE family protein
VDFYICAYQGNPLFTFIRGETQYYRAQALDPTNLRSLLLASSAIPLLFPAGRVGDRLVYDGGLADNTPIDAVRNQDLDRIFVVYLRRGAADETEAWAEPRLIEIAPSRNLGRFPRATLMAAGEGEIQALLDLGYHDGTRALRQL